MSPSNIHWRRATTITVMVRPPWWPWRHKHQRDEPVRQRRRYRTAAAAAAINIRRLIDKNWNLLRCWYLTYTSPTSQYAAASQLMHHAASMISIQSDDDVAAIYDDLRALQPDYGHKPWPS